MLPPSDVENHALDLSNCVFLVVLKESPLALRHIPISRQTKMTAVANASCPFSTASTSSFRQQCTVSKSAPSRQRIDKTHTAQISTSTLPPSHSPAPTSEILYLPPLLSLLPTSHHLASSTTLPPTREIQFTSSRLPDIDDASLALHFALFDFRVRPSEIGHALENYDAAFNWDELRLPVDVQREW